ncbi:hypothetical protein T459_11213 [Capsicum annuum]|uniref:Uncharacterized protein n=1 Tax=Capsicum annuum TaxID=4072 RepID=A0A2G2ZL95_CAPAN|nr:hypothetical protein T459_11213 [Capsicum annuum]
MQVMALRDLSTDVAEMKGKLFRLEDITTCGKQCKRFLGKFVGVEDDVEGQVHAIVDKKMDEHTIVHYSQDIEEVEWDFLDFGERNLVTSGYVDLICKLGIEADSIVGLDLSNSALALS